MKKKNKIIAYLIIVAMLVSGIATCYADDWDQGTDGTYDYDYGVSDDQTYDDQIYDDQIYYEEVYEPEVVEEPVVQEEKKKTGKKGEPELYSDAAAIYCKNTGEIIYSKKLKSKMSPYSITKVMTALLAVQKLPLDQEVTVSAEAASQEGSSMELKEGEVIKVKDLLYGLLMLSGNDAAYALAEAVSGDVPSFVDLMNETAKNISCKNTLFSTPSGFINDVSEHYTTAKDMMEILRVAFDNETVKEIAGTKKHKIPATNESEERVLKNKNEVLLSSDNYVAGKTGYWDDYNSSIVMEYNKDGLGLLIVLMGSQADKRLEDCNELVKYATKKVRGIDVVKAGEAAGKVRVKHGAKTSIKAYTLTAGVAYLPKEGSESLIDTKVTMNDDVKAPVKKGDVVGSYNIYVGDEIVNKIPLVAKEDVKTGWILSYIGISNNVTIVICIVLLLVLALLITRLVNKANAKKRKRAARKRMAMEIAKKQLEKEEYDRRRGWRY